MGTTDVAAGSKTELVSNSNKVGSYLNSGHDDVAHRMLRNLGAPIHCFGQLLRALFREIVVNNHDGERSEFRIIETQYTSRPGDLWGASEMEGTFREWSYALAHAHSLKFEFDFKKK